MQTIPEQISSAARAPIEAQLDLFGSIATATVENTGRLALFQIDAGRAALNQTLAAWRQLMTAGPNTLFDLMSQAQSNLTGMLDSARPPSAATSGAEPSQAADEDPQPQAPAPREMSTLTPGENQAAAPLSEASGQAAALAAEAHAPQPPAHRTPIAEAAFQVVADGQPGPPIVAAPTYADEPVNLPKLKPQEGTPPAPSHTQGGNQRRGLPRK